MFATFPVEPEKYLDLYPEVILKDSEKQAWLKTRNGAIVGRATADRFGFKIGDHVPIKSPIWGEPLGQGQWDFDAGSDF